MSIPYQRDALVKTLIDHQRYNAEKCHCGWGDLGHSHAEHVADQYEQQINRVSEKMSIELEHRTVGLTNVHNEYYCRGRPCCLHNRTDHHIRSWPQHWRDDRGIMERICPHGIGHPDPDQYEYWRRAGRGHEAVHGCDGCCRG